jgi:hypothetical protein
VDARLDAAGSGERQNRVEGEEFGLRWRDLGCVVVVHRAPASLIDETVKNV